jgi:hypothetical protein
LPFALHLDINKFAEKKYIMQAYYLFVSKFNLRKENLHGGKVETEVIRNPSGLSTIP